MGLETSAVSDALASNPAKATGHRPLRAEAPVYIGHLRDTGFLPVGRHVWLMRCVCIKSVLYFFPIRIEFRAFSGFPTFF